ncbi:MAG TPA: OmpH family outer membrane protein [Candidatus Kapabacteria bacterium]|nr:OmpH family outer membrane protein [Candidatus Kapabacteria bacterium]
MKTLIAAAIVVACMYVPVHAQQKQQAQSVKVEYIQSDVILKELPEAQAADTVLRSLGTKWQDTLLQMQKQLQDLAKQLDGPISDEGKQKIRSQAQQLQQQAEAYQNDKFGNSGAYAQKQEELLTPIRQKVKVAIEEIAKEDGVDYVFDKASPAQEILYASDKYDITYRVLDRIKRGK